MNLLVVEDDPAVRAGLTAAMARAPGVVVEGCATVDEALAAAARGPLDVALVDLALPDGSGLQVIRNVRSRHPAATILVVTMFDHDDAIVSALQAGANGYLLKHAHPDALLASVREALDHGRVLSPQVAQRVVKTFWPDAPPPPAVRLGRRERELLEYLQAGLTYEEAAGAMGLRLGTVQGYIKRIYRKLGATTKIEVLRSAARQGLLQT